MPGLAPRENNSAKPTCASAGPRGALYYRPNLAQCPPNDLDVQLKAGNLLLAARKLRQPAAELTLRRKFSRRLDALVVRGNALAGLRSFDDALGVEQAIKLDPDWSVSYTNSGVA